MGWTIDFLPEERVIRVVTEGPMDLPAFGRMTTEAIAAARVHGAHRFLVDHRKMVPRLDRLQIRDLAQMTEALGLTENQSAAIVFAPAVHDWVSLEIYERRCAELGLPQRAFTDPDSALAWLRGQRAV